MFYQTLENSDEYKNCDEDLRSLRNLSQALESFKYPDGSFQDKLEQLQAMWSSRQSEFKELEEQIEPELNVQNDYYEGLESLSEWIDTVEELVESTKNADNYELFKEAEECFQVILVIFQFCLLFEQECCTQFVTFSPNERLLIFKFKGFSSIF